MPPAASRPAVFPRSPLLVGFGLVALALGGATLGSMVGAGAPVAETGTMTIARDLLFEDRSDGAVVVREAADLRPVEVFEGENGFIRGTLRGFARTRHMDNVSPTLPFRLAKWSDGRLTLDDPATGRHVELLAFGATNAAVFARLLTEHAS